MHLKTSKFNQMEYKTRIADKILAKKLASKGAILIEGPKWCGKTTTAEQQAKSILYMDNPASLETNLQMAEIEPSVLLDGDTPRLIDEWQLAPKLWDAIRFEVDHRHEVLALLCLWKKKMCTILALAVSVG